MKFDATRHGRGGVTGGSEHLRERWSRVGELPPGPGEWVPWEAVWIADGVSPRQWDPETAERYAQAYLDLPPITVQRDTFALIDGRHRLEAMSLASFDWVRIVEVDVPAERLAAEAFLANGKHGKPYTTPERISGLRVLWQADKQARVADLARATGLHRHTVENHLSRWAPRPTNNSSSAEPEMSKMDIVSDGLKTAPKPAPVTRERDEPARFSDEWEEPEEDTACPHGRSLERSCPECEEEEGDGVEEDEGVADAGGEVADRGAPAQAIGPVADAVQGAPERATEASPVGEVLRYGLLFEAATGDVAEQLANAMIMPISTGQRVEELAALVVPHAREMNFFRLCRGEILAFWPAFYEALDGLTE